MIFFQSFARLSDVNAKDSSKFNLKVTDTKTKPKKKKQTKQKQIKTKRKRKRINPTIQMERHHYIMQLGYAEQMLREYWCY
jgi:hypothetical protein